MMKKQSPLADLVRRAMLVFGCWCLSALIPVVAADDRPNILLLCVDDLRPELPCYGKDYIHAPNIEQLASRSRLFRRHYVQAPTCGASRFALLTGQYGPATNHALFSRAKQFAAEPDSVSPSMPKWFRQHGYETVSVGKVSHHPGGRGGPDWDDDAIPEMPGAWDRHLLPAGPWQHPRGAMHGLAHGEIRAVAGKMDLFQSVAGPDSIYPDGLITDESIQQLDRLASDDRPFFLAVGIIRPHLPFGAPAKYMEKYEGARLPPIDHPVKPTGTTTWHKSGEFMKYNRWGRDPNNDAEFALAVRRHYAACVSYADAQIGRVLNKVDSLGIRENTIVVLWGDHGWHLGEHAIWGKHSLFEESLHSPLMIQYSDMSNPGRPTDSIVETIDIFPTLCELAGLPEPPRIDGVSLAPILSDATIDGHNAVSYFKKAKTIRTGTHRLIAHSSGEFELYDHRSPDNETRNLADDHPRLVTELHEQLLDRLRNRNQIRKPTTKVKR
jgi:iduronate 2-sulfatase